MKEILPNIFAVEVPADATDIFINNVGCLRYHIDEGRQSSCIEPVQMGCYLDKENYTFLFCSNDVTEEQAAGIVDTWTDETWDETYYKCYMNDEDEYLADAVDSFASLLRSHNLTGNYAIIQKLKPWEKKNG